MGAQRRMVAVKGAILSLLLDAYQRRDRVAMISFRGTGADLLLPPTSSVDLAQVCLQDMPTGGRTPLSRGILMGLEVVEAERMKDRDVLPLLVLLSDGRANVGLQTANAGQTGGASGVAAQALAASAEVEPVAALIEQQRVPSVVIDTETGFIRLGLARAIAQAMEAKYIQLEDLRSETLADAVRQELPGFDPNAGMSATS
jgi:magnesium chelatase subunit D